MREESSNNGEIPGDVFLDRLFGWFIFALALIVIAVSYAVGPAELAPPFFERYRLLGLTLLGSLALTRSSRLWYWVAILAFGLRVLLEAPELQHDPKHFVSSAMLFDLVMVGYVIFRLRSRR